MTDKPQAAYEELVRRARELGVLASCSALLGWDEQTYMPPGGSAHRGEQWLTWPACTMSEPPTAGSANCWRSSRRIRPGWPIPTSPSAVNIRELRRNYDRRIKLPRDLVEELARTTSLAQQEWIAARRDADFGHFRPWLDRIVQLKRQEAECLAVMPDFKTGDPRFCSECPSTRFMIPCSTNTNRGPEVLSSPFSSRRCGKSWCPWFRRSARRPQGGRETREVPTSGAGRGAETPSSNVSIRSIGRRSSERPWPRRSVLTFSGAGST